VQDLALLAVELVAVLDLVLVLCQFAKLLLAQQLKQALVLEQGRQEK
jgi:hypothetical protein